MHQLRTTYAAAIAAFLLILGALLPAQTVRVANHSGVPFEGWKRTTIDKRPLAHAGELPDGTFYVVGRKIGIDTHVVDLRVRLQPGERRTLDLTTVVDVDFELGPLPADPLGHFGGIATVAGVPMDIVGLAADGAAWTFQLRARVGRMLCSHVWLTWYPDQPGVAHAEALTIASNPAVPDMSATVPAGYALRIGDALVQVPGLGVGAPLVAAGTVFADGQGHAAPLTLIWTRHLKRASDWSSAGAAADLGIGAVGQTRLLTDGAPLMPAKFSGLAWAAPLFAPAVQRLHTWDPPVCGPALVSSGAGEQEDQLLHCGGEALAADGAGAELVRYLSALKLFSERPCNHLEADATWLEPDRHPQLLFWDGRVHWHVGVSPDRLGKPRQLTPDEAHGRWGPDVQHTYVRTLVASARLTGSPACQQLLRNLATVYLLQRTANPAWSTSAWESAREWGCEALFVLDCHRDLEDRAMAARVVQRWNDRVERILLPRMEGKTLLMVFVNDPRVNATGLGAQWWQESFASYWIDRACQEVGPVAGRAVAMRIAYRVLDVAWTKADGHWRAQPQGPIDGSANQANPATDGFNSYGMPLCVAAVLRHDKAHEKARAIWTQLLADPGEKARRWMPPGVNQ